MCREDDATPTFELVAASDVGNADYSCRWPMVMLATAKADQRA